MSLAFAHPATRGIVLAAAAVLLLAAAASSPACPSPRRPRPALRRELWLRTGSWAVLLPLMLGPVLLGRAWTIGAVTVLGLLCLREYDRATGLFRETVITATVLLGILAVNAAALDAWYGLFMALIPLTVGVLAIVSIPLDRPSGYIQRTGLAIFAFMLFGAGLAHLGYMANDRNYRPIVLMLLTTVALNDVFAFTFGKLIGGPKLLPATSPNKTVSGAVGALVRTSVLVALIASTHLRRHRAGPLVAAARAGRHRERGGAGGRPDAVQHQARPGHQGHGRRHPRPWRHAGPVQLAPAGGAGGVPLHRLLRRLRPGPARADLHGMTDWQLRPARDHGLTPRQRLRSSGREPGLGGLRARLLWRGLVRCYLLGVHRLR